MRLGTLLISTAAAFVIDEQTLSTP